MINSEGIIKNKGTYSNGTWINVVIQPRYPMSLPNGLQQNSATNTISSNDFVIDNNGFIWKVISSSLSGSNYVCTLQQQGVSAQSSTMEPNVVLEKGIVVTPNSKGLLAPYYHDSYVSTNSFRAAMAHNMKSIGSTGTPPPPDPPLPPTTEYPFFYTEGGHSYVVSSQTNGSVKFPVGVHYFTNFRIDMQITPIEDIYSTDVRGFLRYWYADNNSMTVVVLPDGRISGDNTTTSTPTSTRLTVGTTYAIRVDYKKTANNNINIIDIYINGVLETSFNVTASGSNTLEHSYATYLLCPVSQTYGTRFYSAKINYVKIYVNSALSYNYELDNSLLCSLHADSGYSLQRASAYEIR